MQGLGFFYSLLPWLEKVSGDGFRKACHRHLGYFNTNPYMSPYILGVVSRLEEEGRGAESVKARNDLMGPLGAMGDGFYWATLLPVTVLLGMVLSFFWLHAAPVLFLIVYNIFHLKNRWSYLDLGYLNAHSPLEGAAKLNGKKISSILEHVSAPLMGFTLGLAVFGTRTPATALIIFSAALLMFRKKWKTPAIFAVLALLGIVLGFLGTTMGNPWSG